MARSTSSQDRWTDDPLVRVLRAIAVLAFIALLSLLVIDPARRDSFLEALLVGAILIALLYNVVLTLPSFSIRRGNGNGKASIEEGKPDV